MPYIDCQQDNSASKTHKNVKIYRQRTDEESYLAAILAMF